MQDDKWGEILDKITSSFNVLDKGKEQLEDNVESEYIVFESPAGKVKLVRTTRPAVIDKKVIGANRKGASKAQFEYVYSDTETTSKMEAFREVDGEWESISADNFV